MNFEKVRVGITHGDINGIGYEVIMKGLSDLRILDTCIPIVYGSPKVAAYHRKALNLTNSGYNQIVDASDANDKRVNIINCIDDNIRVELGRSTQAAGEASVMALEKAIQDLKDNKIDVLVTAPICKDNIQSDNFNFPGHTEYLAGAFDAGSHLMLMISANMKIGVVTGHMPITEVAKNITTPKVLEKIRVIHNTLVQDFSKSKPRIAVLGLNPHAGDDGVLGSEEKEIIAPAIKKANEEGIIAMGPYPADGFFGNGLHKKFDAVLAMYHDQGLVPFKALSFDDGVNYTAGLPIVRTSPGHGTAFDITGQNKASESSFRHALYLAIDLFNNRQLYKEMAKDPLKKFDIDKSDGE